MRIAVCLRQGLDGELGPFDAAAYEAALRIEGAEVVLLSMGTPRTGEFLLRLTRLGAKRAYLLTDSVFAGADTLATAYALSRALQMISPDLVFCGRQTLVGDTAQTGPMLAELAGLSLLTNVMRIDSLSDGSVTCQTREGETKAALPALLTLERVFELRLPRIGSRTGELVTLSACEVGADPARCGLRGSPTRVAKTFENQSGRRRCRFISRDELDAVIAAAILSAKAVCEEERGDSDERLPHVCIVGAAPRSYAETVAESITELALSDADTLAREIEALSPDAVLWGSDPKSKRLSSLVAARMGLGLCADCTRLECEVGELAMYRPALSGSVIAKIRSLTRPAMATVRTDEGGAREIVVAAGFGVQNQMDAVSAFAERLGADLAASRKLVDAGIARYETQVGLTGKKVSPPVYIAVGISGAVHHIVGMERAGTVIAINPDRNAPIFDYADYGIVDTF